MPEISFYVLASESQKERNLFSCKLIEKAYRSGTYPYVLTDSPEQSQQLDDLLWTFRPGSFVPHQIYHGEEVPMANTILIGCVSPPENWQKALLNLSLNIPQDFHRFERILEILDNSEATKVSGRIRFKEYRSKGIEISTHNI